MLRGAAWPRCGVGWRRVAAPSRRGAQWRGRGGGSAEQCGVTPSDRARPVWSSDSPRPPARPHGVAVHSPARPALCPPGNASSSATVRPALTAQSRVDTRAPNLRTWKCHCRNTFLWRVCWQTAQKATNMPGVHRSEGTGCCSRPQVQLLWHPWVQWQLALRPRWGPRTFLRPDSQPQV